MTRIDPEQERKRLVEFYSQQMDGELEKVAVQAYELTDLAREALRAEMARRGLSAALVENAPMTPAPSTLPGDPPPDEQPVEALPEGEFEMREMVTIRKFRDLPEALFAKGSLESAGIECAMVDDNMVARLVHFESAGRREVAGQPRRRGRCGRDSLAADPGKF
jgi:hypothetical protein